MKWKIDGLRLSLVLIVSMIVPSENVANAVLRFALLHEYWVSPVQVYSSTYSKRIWMKFETVLDVLARFIRVRTNTITRTHIDWILVELLLVGCTT